jgi:hypothetical protein
LDLDLDLDLDRRTSDPVVLAEPRAMFSGMDSEARRSSAAIAAWRCDKAATISEASGRNLTAHW